MPTYQVSQGMDERAHVAVVTLSQSEWRLSILREPKEWRPKTYPCDVSPYLTHLVRRFHHGLAGLAGERRAELRHIHHHAIDAVLRRRVRIGDGAGAQVLRTIVLAGPLGEADEEALVRSQTVAVGELLVLVGFFPRNVGQNRAAEIGDVFTLGQLRVDVDVVHYNVLAVLVHDTVRVLHELLGVLRGPPVLQISLGVELPPFVIEAVRQFVSYGRSSVAVVGRVVHLGVVQRRLQNSS